MGRAALRSILFIKEGKRARGKKIRARRKMLED